MAAKRGRPYKEQADDLREVKSLEQDILDIGEKHFGAVNRTLGVTQDLAKINQLMTEDGKLREGVSKEQVKQTLLQLKSSSKARDVIRDTIPGIMGMAEGAKSAAGQFYILSKTPLGILSIVLAIGKALLGVAKAVADTRKELGVSAVEAAKITVQTKALGFAAKAYGLDVEDIREAQAAIRQDLGASAQEAVNLSLQFARTSAATGQTSDQLTKTLSIMESISGASRDVLLNQIRANAAMIEAAGVAPSLVMKDLAENTEFFASFAKDGGQNLIMAGTAARKLGLDMSAVASVSDSLLDFESSIESSMEASMLLGRQINTDRARMLAIQGDQEGMMEEVLRQVGGEAEFNKMNVLARRSLAKSVGVNVEQLSRLVRNNQAGTTGAAVGAAMTDPGSDKVATVIGVTGDETNRLLGKLIRTVE